MSQCWTSASEIFLPRLGEVEGDCASATPAPPTSATRRSARTFLVAHVLVGEPAATSPEHALRVDMLDLPFAVDAPAGDAVVMLVGEGERRRHRLPGLPALRHEVGAQRLRVAGLVPGAAPEDRRLSDTA